jgi:WD40 repeat protein
MDRTRYLLQVAVLLAIAAAPFACLWLRQSPEDFVIGNVAFASDGKSLATFSGHDRGRVSELRVWDLSTARERRTERQTLLAPELALSPDGRTITLNTPAGVRPLRELADWPGPVFLNFGRRTLAPDRRILATACLDQTHLDRIQLWDVATGTLAGELTDGELNDCLAFSHDSRTLAAVRSRLVLWDVAARKTRDSPRIGASCLSPVALAPDGSVIAASPPGAVTLWDSTTGAVRGTVPRVNMASAFSFAPNSRRLAIAINDTVTLYELPGVRASVTFGGHVEPPHVKKIKELAWMWGGNPLRLYANSVNAVGFSPDGKLVASGDTHGIVRVWDAVSAQERLCLVHHDDGVPTWLAAAACLWAAACVGLAVRSWRDRGQPGHYQMSSGDPLPLVIPK